MGTKSSKPSIPKRRPSFLRSEFWRRSSRGGKRQRRDKNSPKAGDGLDCPRPEVESALIALSIYVYMSCPHRNPHHFSCTWACLIIININAAFCVVIVLLNYFGAGIHENTQSQLLGQTQCSESNL